MATRRRKEPTIVLLVFLGVILFLILAFIVKGNFQALEEFNPERLYFLLAVLGGLYILYVELRYKRLGRAVVEEKIKTHTLVDALPQAVVVLDDQNTIVAANTPACRLLSADPVEILGRPASEAFDAATAAQVAAASDGRFEGAAHEGGAQVRVTVASLRGEAGKLLVLQEPHVTGGHRAAGAQTRSTTSIFEVTKAAGDLAGVVREAAERISAGMKVEVEGECRASIDAPLLRRSLEEILKNATAHSPDESKVEIRVEGGEKEISVRITDAGGGIPREELARIFDVGFTGSGQKGAGVGLALARRIIESHGGSVWAESEPGRGTRISLNLPRG